jgi:hypothetical protein
MYRGLLDIINGIEEGYSVVIYQGRKYGLSKEIFNSGKSFKLYAEELGGKDFISLNYYLTSQSEILKPCEMPEEKVIHFLSEMEIINSAP